MLMYDSVKNIWSNTLHYLPGKQSYFNQFHSEFRIEKVGNFWERSSEYFTKKRIQLKFWKN